MTTSVSLLGLGVTALAVFLSLHWLKILPTVSAGAALLAPVLIGSNGVVGRLIIRFVRWGVGVTGSVTAWAFGDAVIVLAFLFFAIVFIHDMHPRHQTGRRTAVFGLVVGLLLVAGATGIPALAGVPAHIQHGTTSVVKQF